MEIQNKKEMELENYNSFALLALFNREAKKAGFSKEWILAVKKQAIATDRENLLSVLAKAFGVIKK